MTHFLDSFCQSTPVLGVLPEFPEGQGRAGMFAGTSKGILFCMGGTNFPDKMPWKGGTKKWYDDIYMLKGNSAWERIKAKLAFPAGYGVSVSYKDKIILIGGNNENQDLTRVMSFQWNGGDVEVSSLPDLPLPLSYMAGTVINGLVIIACGRSNGVNTKICLALDLENPSAGWFELDSLPGRERSLPVCAAYKNRFYLFSGETAGVTAGNREYIEILQDAYQLTLSSMNGKRKGGWQKLSPMPKGMAAGGSPIPVFKNGDFFFWGGVDAISSLNKIPENETGIPGDMLLYHPDDDTWDYLGAEKIIPARVTLPVVYWKDQWVYICGEIKSGVRTISVISVR